MWIIKKIKQNQSGFSLAETLMAVLILLMVSEVVAVGIPSAASALSKIVDASNAQLLLSTTITKLRDELSTARVNDTDKIECDSTNTTIQFVDGSGIPCVITCKKDDNPGIYIKEGTTDERLFISNAASNKNLHAECSFSYDKGIVTIGVLKILKGDKEIVREDAVKINVLAADKSSTT